LITNAAKKDSGEMTKEIANTPTKQSGNRYTAVCGFMRYSKLNIRI
jgi:hypothetical protein